MPWIDAFAPVEARNRANVMKATWGHLAPSQGRAYKGHIVFAVGIFGSDHLNPTAIACNFRGLDSSPWFFDAMADFMTEQRGKPGCIYRFDGTFKDYKFVGTIKRLRLETK